MIKNVVNSKNKGSREIQMYAESQRLHHEVMAVWLCLHE